MEPTTTTAATGFAISKIYYALSALFASMVVLFLSKKPTLAHHGRIATGAIVGGTAVGFGVIFGGALAVWFGMDPYDANVATAVGGGIGLFAFAIARATVKFFDRIDDKDIIEVVQEVRTAVRDGKTAPVKSALAKKTPARKTPAKKAAKR